MKLLILLLIVCIISVIVVRIALRKKSKKIIRKSMVTTLLTVALIFSIALLVTIVLSLTLRKDTVVEKTYYVTDIGGDTIEEVYNDDGIPCYKFVSAFATPKDGESDYMLFPIKDTYYHSVEMFDFIIASEFYDAKEAPKWVKTWLFDFSEISSKPKSYEILDNK